MSRAGLLTSKAGFCCRVRGCGRDRLAGLSSAGVKKTSAGVKISEIFDPTQGQNLKFNICR